MVVQYLVSGAEDIRPSHEVIRRSGRRVRHDDEIRRDASRELRRGRAYVVVAHGDETGTVYLYRTADGRDERWLWVGMNDPPEGARVYLYSCHAGPLLRRFLRQCDALGHEDRVPMPLEPARETVLRYFVEVDRLLSDVSTRPEHWEKALRQFLDNQFARLATTRLDVGEVATLMLLRKSLGYAK